MKRIGWQILVLFAISFLGMLMFAAPASLLSTIVESKSKGHLVLANASGTVWQGNAIPAIRKRIGNLLALERLHWDVSVLPLFTGKIVCKLRWDNVKQVQPMTVELSFNQIELRNAILPLYANVLSEFSPFLQPLQLGGEMEIRSENFIYSRQDMTGAAIIEWINADSALSSVKPLGHYRVNLIGTGERLDIELMTISGMLILEGKGGIVSGEGIRFQGTARASPDSNGALDELLNNFGSESAPGVHNFNLTP